MTVPENTPTERAVLATVPFLATGLAVSLLLLLVPKAQGNLTLVTMQLGAVVLLGLVAAFRLVSLAGSDWYLGLRLSPFWRLVASGVSVVFLVTGMIGLVTLASSAALRYPPSLQFLQLLSALDIAWVATAAILGAWRGLGRTAAAIVGAVVGVACVWSIWNYLRVVGFAPDGGWLVDGDRLWRLVIPADTVFAIFAVTAFVLGTRHAAQAMEQASPQS